MNEWLFPGNICHHQEGEELVIDDVMLRQFGSKNLLDKMARYHLKAGGKRLRGRLALLEAQDWDIDIEMAVYWAVACEFLHNATLIHDDIQDHDPFRRGQQSLWGKYGVAQAINAGDLFILKAFDFASRLDSPALPLMLSETAQMLVRGQSEELDTDSSYGESYWAQY